LAPEPREGEEHQPAQFARKVEALWPNRSRHRCEQQNDLEKVKLAGDVYPREAHREWKKQPNGLPLIRVPRHGHRCRRAKWLVRFVCGHRPHVDPATLAYSDSSPMIVFAELK
jgi:hypothetical protein